MAKLKIAIDAGHGSNTPGKRTPPFTNDVDINTDGKIDIKKGAQYPEHYANVGIANLLYTRLKEENFDVIRTGWDDSNSADDKDISLSKRQNMIKNAGCDYSISIHFNAYGDGKAFNTIEGVSVYIHSEHFADSRHFADYVLQELSKGTRQKNRGIHSASYAMCNCETMGTKASILCEIAFMTNQREAQELMAKRSFWEECANEITTAVKRYCNCNDQEEPDTGTRYYLYHIVQSGDTLNKLAAEYDTTVQKLIQLNQIKDPDVIDVGQKLKIMKFIKYTAKKGDTLSKLSQTYLGSADRYEVIKRLNHLSSDTIYVGQILKIPVV
ncbi:MAG: hypothetical protein K0R46_3523 [Herbinix sp.]|jgi:N-acetylmuramoyl-L-alanine amidase|nr:hypothetical protein [Herbinix sp.]